ncbi:MAG: hypothetical protein CEN90_102 [Parcubacteria group bacterium Licking1014_17]|nr:MAG: hypothetical protein CEN90_102 [Parcubacteria group bacterium Licking1014_17]
MRKILTLILMGVAVFSAGYFFDKYEKNTCRAGVAYSIGNVDQKFNVSEEQLIEVASKSESMWEKAVGRDMFHYDPKAKLAVNLIFDDRQQSAINETKSREKIAALEQSYEGSFKKHESLTDQYKEQAKLYDELLSAYNESLNSYNSLVNYWNNNGGAPDDIYNDLEQKKASLSGQFDNLEIKRNDLNSLAARVNDLGKQLANITSTHNSNVDHYNVQFSAPKRFDQGDFSQNTINIYQFSDINDLTLVMAHEMGHAFGLEHITSSASVMNALMEGQDRSNLAITADDLNAVKIKCGYK